MTDTTKLTEHEYKNILVSRGLPEVCAILDADQEAVLDGQIKKTVASLAASTGEELELPDVSEIQELLHETFNDWSEEKDCPKCCSYCDDGTCERDSYAIADGHCPKMAEKRELAEKTIVVSFTEAKAIIAAQKAEIDKLKERIIAIQDGVHKALEVTALSSQQEEKHGQ